MSSIKINIKTDAEIKKNAEAPANTRGATMTEVSDMSLKGMVSEGEITFDVTTKVPNSVTAQAIEEGRRKAKDCNASSYDSVEKLKAAMGLRVDD